MLSPIQESAPFSCAAFAHLPFLPAPLPLPLSRLPVRQPILPGDFDKLRFTVTGILPDRSNPGMDFLLKEFCQNVYRASERTDDEIVQEPVRNGE